MHSAEEALGELKKYSSDSIYIIGGSSIYHQFLSCAKEALITYIQYEYTADAWFPKLDGNTEWELKQISEKFDYCGIKYEFRQYIRNKSGSCL